MHHFSSVVWLSINNNKSYFVVEILMKFVIDIP